MSPALFQKLDALSKGVIKISWHFLPKGQVFPGFSNVSKIPALKGDTPRPTADVDDESA
jgi:hypothetical protein